MVKGLRLRDLSKDVLLKVFVYLIEEFKGIKIKYNKTLKKIQQKYKLDVNIITIFIDLFNRMINEGFFIDLEEDAILCIKPKIKIIDYIINLILRQKHIIEKYNN